MGIPCTGLLSFRQHWLHFQGYLSPWHNIRRLASKYCVVSWTSYRQMWKPQSKAGAEPQLGWTKVHPSAVWADNHLDIVSGWISLCPASVRTGHLHAGLARQRLCCCRRLSLCSEAHSAAAATRLCSSPGHLLPQPAWVLPGIPAVWRAPLLRCSSLEVLSEEGQTSLASRSQLYLYSSKNKQRKVLWGTEL